MRHPSLVTDWGPTLLVWSCLLVLPFGRVVEVPVLVMAVAGLVLLIKRGREWVYDPSLRLFSAVFLCAWIPILLSLPDAVNPSRSIGVAVNHLRFYLAGVFILYALGEPRAQGRFLRLCAWLLLFWILDGFAQSMLGRDLFRYEPLGGTRLNALFGQRTPKYSLTLAVLAPFLWEHARRHWSRWAQSFVVILTVYVVLVAGTRSAWISICALFGAYLVFLWFEHRRFPLRSTVGIAVLLTAVGLSGYFLSAGFAHRVQQTAAAFTGEVDPLQDAIGHRIWIWKGARNLIQAHPINGVGARGFRYAYPKYADPEDPYLLTEPPTHSHQLLLETLSETGMVGVLGLVTMAFLLIRIFWRASSKGKLELLAPGMCLVVAYFPANTHMAIYSSFWSQLVWWLIALYCAAYAASYHSDGATEETLRDPIFAP